MKYSIDLEPPFAYSAYWYAIGLGLILLAVLLRYLFNRIFMRPVESPFKIDKLHKQAIARIDGIDKSYRDKQCDLRTMHQNLSREVRQYAQTMEGLRAESMVYDELCQKARPDLADVIGDYYGPEFAYKPQADPAASVAKAKASIDAHYQRVLKEKRINSIGRARSRINDILRGIGRVAPGFLASAVLSLIRFNSTNWIDSIQKAATKGNLDSYSVRGQVSKAVRSFVRSAAGVKTDAEAFKVLEEKRKSGKPELAAAAVSARDFYDPDFMYRSSYNPSFAIVKGKELIKKWV